MRAAIKYIISASFMHLRIWNKVAPYATTCKYMQLSRYCIFKLSYMIFLQLLSALKVRWE